MVDTEKELTITDTFLTAVPFFCTRKVRVVSSPDSLTSNSIASTVTKTTTKE